MNGRAIDPGLIAALESFGTIRLSPHHEAATTPVFVFQEADGKRRALYFEDVCAQAAKILASEDLMHMKFHALTSGLKSLGLGRAYEQIMGEPLP